jgi:AcrR family transcriptional regulator
MARPRTIDVAGVVDAARDVFARHGLRRALMSDIARAAGVSVGTLYNIATSKDALFLAIFLEPADLAEQALPLPIPAPAELVERVSGRLTRAVALPAQAAALLRPRADDPGTELHALIAERYDAIAQNWKLLSAVEQTARDIPEVAVLYYDQGRGNQINELARYLALRIAAGQLRDVDAKATARFIIEAVAWWAWHRHEDHQAPPLDDAAARGLLQDLLAAALLVRSGAPA